ncbi:hypothetical protein L596_011185 [Steinernema carpocapsae]|uniref:Uncharacterized protein n=1 Tax=Steinernema carpocapsae TaxID=34508 RepID=A0A4U5NTZ8_STECR|nr:hypothetical protein L596_011185 [Steinernema carpocapsae]
MEIVPVATSPLLSVDVWSFLRIRSRVSFVSLFVASPSFPHFASLISGSASASVGKRVVSSLLFVFVAIPPVVSATVVARSDV